MITEFLYLLPTWAVFLIYISILLASLELGYFVGQRLHASWKDADPTNGQIILTSMFAVLGLMLAFTYAAAHYKGKQTGKKPPFLSCLSHFSGFFISD